MRYPLADLLQDLVACVMTVQIVDQLEPVKIQIGQCHRFAVSQLGHGAVQRLFNAAAVKDLGQRVIVGQKQKVFRGPGFFSNVLQ